MANALDDVRYTFTSLDANYRLLWDACQGGEQRGKLEDQYDAAEEAYDKCADQMLSDGDAAVALLAKDLRDANTLVDGAVKEMGDMSKVIDDVTEAVSIGAKLIKVAGI